MKEIEYNLRFALSSRTLKVTEIEKIHAECDEHFQKKHSGTKTVFSFVNTLITPVKVPVCRPFIDETKTQHELVYCEVAVGNAIYANEAYALKYDPPADFDCFVTQRDGGKTEEMTEFNKKIEKIEIKDKKSAEVLGKWNLMKKKEELKNKIKTQNSIAGRRNYSKEGGNKCFDLEECNTTKKEEELKLTKKRNCEGINDSLINGSVINNSLFCIDDSIDIDNAPPNYTACYTNGSILKHLSVNNCYYVINDMTRINPLYKVKFDYDIKMEGLDDKLCENCCVDLRVCFCHAERAQLCAKCDDLLHFNELTARHRRHYFEDEGTKFLNCGTHSVVIEFWCVNCEEPVCTYCRVDTHIGHELINYTHAWAINENLLKSMKKVDEMTGDVKDSIAAFKEDFTVFGLKIQNLKKKIEEEYLKTIREIDLLYARNCKIIFKDFVEKLAEEEKLRKVKEFTPNNFMNFFKVIKQQRNNLSVELTKMEIDPIKVQGGFKINTKDITKREGIRPRDITE